LKQKKVLFGEMPDRLSTKSFVFRKKMSLIDMKRFTVFGSKDYDADIEELVQQRALFAQKARKPFYILNHDNKALVALKTVLWLLVIPSVVVNLYWTAFEMTQHSFVHNLITLSEILFGVELVL
jgi:hypothetical protein